MPVYFLQLYSANYSGVVVLWCYGVIFTYWVKTRYHQDFSSTCDCLFLFIFFMSALLPFLFYIYIFPSFTYCIWFCNSFLPSFSSHYSVNRYKKLLRTVDLTRDFFFSYSYHIMLSLQKNMSNCESGLTLYDTMFVWNEFLTRGIRHQLKNTLWTVALVYGFFKQVIYISKCFKFVLKQSKIYFELTLVGMLCSFWIWYQIICYISWWLIQSLMMFPDGITN